MKNKEALKTMVEVLEIFEELQKAYTTEFWRKLNEHLFESDTVTWTQISDFKEALLDFQDEQT